MKTTHSKHQILEYNTGHPFWAGVATYADTDYIYVKNSHWHEDLELAYVLDNRNYHYINGTCVEAVPGSLVITNCESIHRIEVDRSSCTSPFAPATLVLTISRPYLDGVFPQHQELRFTNEDLSATAEEKRILQEFIRYAGEGEYSLQQSLFMQGLLLQLLASLLGHRAVKCSHSHRQDVHVKAIKDILDYVEAHYSEPLTQAKVAEMFYFSPQNFSRFFKNCTGTTFSEHLTAVRLSQARKELLQTDKQVRNVAVSSGFVDDKVFIRAFKKSFGTTPLQYRKNAK